MKKLLLVLFCVSFGYLSAQGSQIIKVVMETELGEIEVELYKDKAPITVENFLAYVDSGYYSYGSFIRTVKTQNQPNNLVKIDVIQADAHPWYTEALPKIEHETTEKTRILHKNGAISMARNEPGTASSSFFICIGDQPELDFNGNRNPDKFGFSAFGKVTSGMNVVKMIHQANEVKQALISPIRILQIVRL